MLSPKALLLLCFAIFATSAYGEVAPKRAPVEATDPGPVVRDKALPEVQSILGEFTFDGPGGIPDPQGWTGVDAWAQTDTFFQVEDFVGISPPYTNWSGDQSLWCGIRADDPRVCAPGSYPGYGNNWVQDFTSQPFALSGPDPEVSLEYFCQTDLEGGYDFLHVQYLSVNGIWHTLTSHTGNVLGVFNHVAFRDSLSSTVQFRFLVETDGSNSDEDGLFDSAGAVIIDDIIVSGSGVLYAQDFESEAVGAKATNDGFWSAGQAPSFGNFAGLVDGSTVLQEDPQVTNNSSLWSFFNGSTEQCEEYGTLPLVPAHRPGDLVNSDFLNNEVRSPEIPLDVDLNGNPAIPADSLIVDMDVYRDLAFDRGVFYGYRARYRVDGCLTPWSDPYFYYYSDTQTWYTQSQGFSVPSGATHVQVALWCRDNCQAFANCSSGLCHSQGPLFDNVTIRLVKAPLVVTNTNNAGEGSLREAILQANLEPDHDRIVFNIPGTGSIIQLESHLPVLTYPVEIDATTDPDYGPEPSVELSGSLVASLSPALSLADSCEVRGLAIHGFSGNGIQVEGVDVVIEACHIGRSPHSEAVPGNGNYGIFIDDTARNCQVGGPGSGQGNVITGHPTRALVVKGNQSTGNAIRGNSIFSNGSIGIDLAEDFVTYNDIDDADTGPNNRQNFPVVTMANAAAGVIEAELASQPGQIYEIDFYQSTFCAVAGHGEGQAYFGTQSVTTDSEGMGQLRFATSLTMVPGRRITATATDAQGNTSEFSLCYEIPADYLVTSLNDSGAGSMRQAIIDANSDGLPSLISFDIPSGAGRIIYLATALPAITAPIVIDGYSQPGSTPNTNAVGSGLNAFPGAMLFGPSLISGDGLLVTANDCRIQGLSICTFPGNGIRIQGERNRVLGCYLGVQPDGVSGLSIAQAGVRVDDLGVTDTNTIIGGGFPAYRNLISANSGQGIAVLGAGVRIEGNLIGTDASGLVPLGNNYGVEFNTALAVDGVVGGNNIKFRNVISGNTQLGIQMSSDSGTAANNYIGVGRDGTTPVGNGTFGILISGNSNLVGSGSGNIVAYNGFDGIRIFSGSNNRVWENSIHSNGQLGIDVGTDGVSPLPGSFTPVPVLTGVDTNQNQIYATLTSFPNTSMRVHFFANAACDPSGYGEGETYLGETVVTTGGSGSIAWTFNSPVNLTGGEFLTAMSEHPTQGSSEFGLCLEAENTPMGNDVGVSLGEAGSDVNLTFDSVGAAGNTSAVSGETGPVAPSNFTLGEPPVFWDLSTTAVFSDSIEVCLPYDPATLAGTESDLVLLHWDETLIPPAWVDITSSRDPDGDFICGRTASLSPFTVGSTVGVSSVDQFLPGRLSLHPPAPNPFNPQTAISFDVPGQGRQINLTIFDIRGHRVRSLVAGHMPGGRHQVTWKGEDDGGRQVASGIYFARLDDGRELKLQKMVLLE